MQAMQLARSRPSLALHAQSRVTTARRARPLRVNAHLDDGHDEGMLPIFKPKTGFTDKELVELAHPHLLGGKTIGEELTLIRERYLASEAAALENGEKHLYSDKWQGDVYVGSRWNELSILYLIFMLTPMAGLLFAYLSYGKLWGITPGLY